MKLGAMSPLLRMAHAGLVACRTWCHPASICCMFIFVVFGPRRYTGFIPGMQETYKKTPVLAQVEVKEPSPDSFLYSRTIVSGSAAVGHAAGVGWALGGWRHARKQQRASGMLSTIPASPCPPSPQASPKGPPAKDVQTHKPEPDVLWPSLQASAVQGSLKPPPNTMALGDMRIDVFRTS